jgi:hypothetical protein
MVTQFPLDVMHLVDLGVARKILKSIFDTSFKFLNKTLIQLIDKEHVALAPFVPLEFVRKPRTFDELARWKATEFRLFNLYTGTIIFKKVLSENHYFHFLLLHCSIRLLSERVDKESKEIANEMLNDFVQYFPGIYGFRFVNSNVHNLLHLSESYENFGPLYTFSNYRFENYLQIVKNNIKSPRNILQQLSNRIEEFNKFPSKPKIKKNENVIAVGKFTLKVNGKDNFVILHSGHPVKIVTIDSVNKKVSGQKYLNSEICYEMPTNSKKKLEYI